MKGDIIAIFLVVAGFFGFFGSLVAIDYWSSTKNCEHKWDSFKPSYSYWGGCKIQINGKVIPADSIREAQP
jgi:hypothetical protein